MFVFFGGGTVAIHEIAGLIAFARMLIVTVRVPVGRIRKDEKMIMKFHRFSLAGCLIWFMSYFSPIFFSITDKCI